MNKIHCIDPIGQGLQWKMLQCIYKSFHLQSVPYLISSLNT